MKSAGQVDKKVLIELRKGDYLSFKKIYHAYAQRLYSFIFKVVKDVDPFNEKEYINALQTGVAHSKTTTTPNKQGNVFLFAHSAVNFYERNMYSVYFYLLGELEKEDEIFVSYEGIIYKYRVQEVKIVNREDIQYLKRSADPDTLVLMTCYPAGTDWKRTVVIAHRDIDEPILK